LLEGAKTNYEAPQTARAILLAATAKSKLPPGVRGGRDEAVLRHINNPDRAGRNSNPGGFQPAQTLCYDGR